MNAGGSCVRQIHMETWPHRKRDTHLGKQERFNQGGFAMDFKDGLESWLCIG